jgi:hypothetical protein
MKANFETGTKVCSKCRVEQPVGNFRKDAAKSDGLRGSCGKCDSSTEAEYRRKNPEKIRAYSAAYSARHLERARQRRYGISTEDVAGFLNSQGGKCPGCLESILDGKFDVDHCHATGKVRGLLCRGCNVSMGRVKDDPEILIRLANYLQKARLEV